MSRAPLELDFFNLEKETTPNSSPKSHFHKFNDARQRSFRGIQSMISKIDPEIIKSVISSGSGTGFLKQDSENGNSLESRKSFSVPSTPRRNRHQVLRCLPVYTPRSGSLNNPKDARNPLTIFYNGSVSVFDLPDDKAKLIIKLAEKENSKYLESEAKETKAVVSSLNKHERLQNLNADLLPMYRRQSLQRFMEKRKERLTSVTPYACPT